MERTKGSGVFMLLLTDRPERSYRIVDALRQLGPCKLLELAEATKAHPSHLMIVCHVEMQDDRADRRLSDALQRHRVNKHVPVLFVIDAHDDASKATAARFGADEIADDHADAETLRQAVRDARRKVRARSAGTSDTSASGDLQKAGQSLTSIFSAAREGKRISKAGVSDGAEALVAMVRRTKIKDWVGAVRSHDNATYQHCLLVAGLIANFGMSLSLSVTQQHALTQAALLHDLGKVGVPTAILNKPGALTEAERRIVETHPGVGYELLLGQSFDAQCLDVVKHHHEFLDGSGYPDRLSGSQISEQVRITTICDVFAALIERRPYRASCTPQQAEAKLEDLGSKLDRGLVGDFGRLVQEM